MKHFSILFSFLILFSCNKKDTETNTEPQNNVPDAVVMENASNAKKWLTQSIEGHFAKDNPQMIMMTTPEFYEFKIDALNANLGLPGSITKEEFIKKWTGKFDLNRKDVFNAFLIPSQDFGKIKVKSCEFDKNQGDTLIFNVQISDINFNTDYKSVIKVLTTEKGFLLADQIQEMN